MNHLHLISFLLLLPFASFSQGQCLKCLVFQGDSISVDSSLNNPNLPNVNNPEDYRHLEDGLWTVPFGEESIYIIFEMKDGKLNGRVIEFAFSTSIDKINEADRFLVFHFENGKANGEYIEWWSYKDSLVFEKGQYLNNKEEGSWITYYSQAGDHVLFSEQQYQNGWLHGKQKYYHSNGKLSEEKEYVEGTQCGLETRYYSNGQKALERIFYCESGYIPDNFDYINSWDQQGKPMVVEGEGIHKMYHENGKVWKTGPVVNGKRHGEWKKYAKDGGLIKTELYEDGVRVK